MKRYDTPSFAADRRGDEEQMATPAAMPSPPRVPGAHPLVEKLDALIQNARDEYDNRARKSKKQRDLWGYVTLLGPAAVIALAIQIAVQIQGIAYIAAEIVEIALIIVAVLLTYLAVGFSHKKWIEERMLAELLRREEFLFRARVGPYLAINEPHLEGKVLSRLDELQASKSSRELLALLMQTKSWRDALEDSRGVPTGLPDFQKCVDTYVRDRAKFQRDWMARRSLEHLSSTISLEKWARGILFAGLVLSFVRGGLLLVSKAVGTSPTSNHHWVVTLASEHPWVTTLAIVIFAVGVMLFGIRAFTGSETLGPSYAVHAGILTNYVERLLEIQHSPEVLQDLQYQHEFQRIVLNVEEVLSTELQTWWILMGSAVPRPI
jgi:Protein of unknown function (DUF4231)